MSETNTIVNSAYHATVVGSLMMANSWMMKKFLKIKPANLSQLDPEDVLKLTVSVMSSTMIKDWLVKQGIIPDELIK